MTATNVTIIRLGPISGTPSKGYKLGFLDSVAYAAQNDTWVCKNAKEVIWACMTTDADGVANPVTIATNIITGTSATATAASGFVIYK